ncbi:jerky protein homolog-like [Stegodyphus dumicola]|uniref:jerky protein homolog-like n=1 Tax=Stegodyphus dumicola TaxID=202533 RepID=UPI0015B310AD|nr:jerky protein homolog-like [Stegodyphus dumicola]
MMRSLRNFECYLQKCWHSGKNNRHLATKEVGERVTILACSNATGSRKFKLALTGKSKNPRTFKKVNTYTNGTEKPTMIFLFSTGIRQTDSGTKQEGCFHQTDPMEQYLTSSHPDTEQLGDEDIRAMFLPPKVTLVCQPIDQDVLEALKKMYRRKFLSFFVLTFEEVCDTIEKLKKIDMLYVNGWIVHT